MKLTIEKMIYGGDGLAHLPPDGSGRGKTVFVPFVLPAEQVEVTPTEQKPGFVRARAEKILRPSQERTEPPCPYFLHCGGCHYQHTSYENQLSIKSQILRETLLRTAKIDWKGEIEIHSAEPLHYRNRTRMKVQHSPFAIGYYKFNSHELLPVEQCPISSPLINSAVAAIWKVGETDAIANTIAEIEFFADAADEKLLLKVYLSGTGKPSDLESSAADFFRALTPELPPLKGVAAFFQGQPAQSFGYEGVDSLQYRTSNSEFRVSAGSFFQVNRFLIDDLVATATAGAEGKLAWDLYAGVGLFSLALAKSFERVVAVESSPASSDDLSHNALRNTKPIQSTTERFLEQNSARAKSSKPDFILADPPRAGLGPKVAKQLSNSGAAQIAYVSCDPATLARDLRVLLDAGYKIDSVHLFDLFPQTFHIETVARLSR
ncbi:MAG: 23S rRNA (uracil(1939)-C(5))-methyltransferase RlmD [Terriglobales bacterium]